MPTPASVSGPEGVVRSSRGEPAHARVRQAFCLSGIVPLGAFLIAHLAMNARALGGGQAFARAVGGVHRLPGLPLVESLFVFAPLLFHGGLGVWLVATRRSLEPAAPYPPGLRVSMRVTAIVALAFLAMHLPELRFRLAGVRLDGDQLATVLDGELSAMSHGVPWRGLAYLVGAGCVAFHFACGLWGYYATTVAARTRPDRRRMAAWAAAALGLVIVAGFADVIVLRATGAPLFGDGGEAAPTSAPCPP